MYVTVIVQRYRGEPVQDWAVDSPRGRLRLVKGNPSYAALIEEAPAPGQKPKLLLPKLWRYDVSVEDSVMIVQGDEKIGSAVYFQEWRCLIRRNQQQSEWP